ncbi:MAG: ATP-binding protein [Desulfovibrionaceae bacterium]
MPHDDPSAVSPDAGTERPHGPHATEALSENIACVWDHGEFVYRVGVIGTGPGFMSVLDLAENPIFREFLPEVQIVGMAEPGSNAAKLDYARRMGVPLYESAEALLTAHPEMTLLLDLSGHASRADDLRRLLKPTVSLLHQDAAVFVCGLHDMAKSTSFCRINLDRQRVLLQAIIDEVREDILLLDREGRVVDMNRHVWQRTGRTKEALIGKPCWEVMTKADGSLFCPARDEHCPMQACLASGREEEAMLTRVSEDGRLLYFRVYAYPIRSQGQGLGHVMIMHRDITARTQREKNEQQTDKLALLGEMSTYLAHEIRNPLMAIGGFTNSLLRSENLTDKEREKLSIVAEETKRLDRMLGSILNFARPTKCEAAEVDLAEAVRETLELMQVGYEPQGYRFRVALAPDLPMVRGNLELIKQCLVNMIKNGIEAMPGGGEIRIVTGLERDLAFLRVSDDGCGMSEADLKKVFSPFYTTKERGYGLGLAMMKKVVEELGGHIDLVSREGMGTTVTLYFQAVLAGADGVAGPTLPEPGGNGAPNAFRP